MAPNKHGYLGNEVERSFDQFVMALRSSRLPAITATYHGLKHKDPERCLQQLELWDYRIGPDQWADYAVRQLCGAAAAWAEKYPGLHIDWPEFCERFRYHFTCPHRNAELLAELYGQKQKWESAELFLLGEIKLLRHLVPEYENSSIPMLIQQLHPRLRVMLQVPLPPIWKNCYSVQSGLRKTFGKRTRKAVRTLWSLDRVQGSKQCPAASTESRDPRQNSSQVPKCHYCPSRHIHWDYPEKNTQHLGN